MNTSHERRGPAPFLSMTGAFLAWAAVATGLLLPGDGGGAEPVEIVPRAEDVATRVSSVESQLSRIRTRLDSVELVSSRAERRDPSSSEDAAELDARIALLEERLSHSSSGGVASSAGGGVGSETPADPGPTVDDHEQVALDLFAAPEARLAALRALRDAPWLDGEDQIGSDVVLAMIALAERTDDANLRADVWRQLHGQAEPALRDALLWSLGNDPNADVRGEAAESLDEFLPDPQVERALRDAAAGDPDGDVRDAAVEALESQ